MLRRAGTAHIEVPGANPRFGGFQLFTREFSVAEFRVPEFEVTTSAERADYIDGDSIAVSARASFFFGGPVAGAPTRWTVFSRSTGISYGEYPGYSFSPYDRYQPSVFASGPLAESRTTTNAAGIAEFSTRATITGNQGAQEYQLGAAVTDQNQQESAASTTVIVHPAAVQVGIRPASYVATAGRAAAIRLATLRVGGIVLGGQPVTVRVYEREWVTSKIETTGGGRLYKSEPSDTLLQTLSGTTGPDGRATLEFVPRRSGQLFLVAETADERARIHRSVTYLWVSGEQSASWRVTNDDTVEVLADRDSYQVGDVAEVLVPVPFPGSVALVTTERGRVLERSTSRFNDSTVLLRVPIEDRHVPNVFVSVVMYRPPTAEDPLPRYKIGTVNLHVSTASRVLTVSVTPDRERAEPGESVRFDIEVRDHLGRPAQAEVSLAVVDKAVLSLAQEVGANGVRAFWYERGLGVITAASVAVSIERTNDVISELQSGGKGDGADSFRRDFRNTAFWAPQLRTDANGHASAEVVLPDNLTTWRAQARAIDGAARFGETTSELLVTRPLIVRPALPRFLRVGDELQLRTLIRNGTLEPFEVDVSLEASGVDVSGDLDQRVAVPAGASVPVEWPARVSEAGNARIAIKAERASGLTDAILLERPVFADETMETTATGGVVEGDAGVEGVYLPEFALTQRGGLEVGVQSSLIGPLERQLWRFAPPVYAPELESAPSVASRIIATVGAARSRPGAPAPPLDRDVARLIGLQRGSGGFAPCRLCDPDPHTTAWVALALADAGSIGNNAGRETQERAAGFIEEIFNRPRGTARIDDPNEVAYLSYVLARTWAAKGTTGRAPESVVSPMRALAERSDAGLNDAGRAYLLLGLTAGGARPDDREVRRLLNELTASVVPSANGSHWENPPRSLAFHPASRTTALVLHALAVVDPRHPLIEETVRWLQVSADTSPAWGIEGAAMIAALGEYGARTGERAGTYDYAVRLDQRELVSGRFAGGGEIQFGRAFVGLSELGTGKMRPLTFSKSGGAGRLYYTLNLRYPIPATESEALNRGFAVSHEYSIVERPGARVRSARLGETVRVRITVTTPAERQRVVLHDLLPAGLEPVDPRLQNTSPELRKRLEDERQKAILAKAPAYAAPWFAWYYSPWRSADLRDDRLTLHADTLPAGVHEYIYFARATTPGTFIVPPPVADEAPFPEVFGRGDVERFTVLP